MDWQTVVGAHRESLIVVECARGGDDQGMRKVVRIFRDDGTLVAENDPKLVGMWSAVRIAELEIGRAHV